MVAEEFSKATLEKDSSLSRELTLDPSKPTSTRDDEDTIPSPKLSLRVGEGEEFEPSEAWVEEGETKTVPKKIRGNSVSKPISNRFTTEFANCEIEAAKSFSNRNFGASSIPAAHMSDCFRCKSAATWLNLFELSIVCMLVISLTFFSLTYLSILDELDANLNTITKRSQRSQLDKSNSFLQLSTYASMQRKLIKMHFNT
ncbi:hypothetical protein Peur_004729 [Populus x canadensis]